MLSKNQDVNSSLRLRQIFIVPQKIMTVAIDILVFWIMLVAIGITKDLCNDHPGYLETLFLYSSKVKFPKVAGYSPESSSYLDLSLFSRS